MMIHFSLTSIIRNTALLISRGINLELMENLWPLEGFHIQGQQMPDKEELLLENQMKQLFFTNYSKPNQLCCHNV